MSRVPAAFAALVLVANLVLVAFGVWCWAAPVRRGWPSARAVAWIWVAVETANGIGHSLWALRRAQDAPGAA